MNDVEYYTLQELILELRKEYQKSENKLENLKALCFVDQKEVSDFRFELVKLSSREIALYCIATKKRSLCEKLKIKLGFIINEEEKGKYLRTKTGTNYFLNKKLTFPVVVSGVNQDNFTIRASALIDSTFAKNIQTNYISFDNSSYTSSLYLDHSKIEIHIDSNTDSNSIKIKYDKVTDEIEIVSKERKIDANLIEELLKIEIPKQSIPEYHKQILNNKHNRNITIDELNKPRNSIRLQIYEDAFQTLLIPTTLKRTGLQSRISSKNEKYHKILKHQTY